LTPLTKEEICGDSESLYVLRLVLKNDEKLEVGTFGHEEECLRCAEGLNNRLGIKYEKID